MSEWKDIIAAGHELPYVEPGDDRREEVRTSITVAAQQDDKRAANAADALRGRRWLAIPAFAAAVAAAVVVGLWIGGDRATRSPIIAETPHRATVEASEGAHFTHTAREADEIVRLARGRVTVRVAKLKPGERFRVVTGDAEVEVRGTSFDVDVVDDKLRAVVVHSGLVEVRPAGQPPLLLSAGDSWSATIARVVPDPPSTPEPIPPTAPVAATHADAVEAPRVPAAPAVRPQRPVRPRDPAAVAVVPARVSPVAIESTPVAPPVDEPAPVAPPERPRAPAADPTDAELAFAAGWSKLRAGDYGSAADEFSRATSLAPSGPLAEDARYWRAIALARAGRDTPARTAMSTFLRKHPASARAPEVATMLGWLLLDAGDVDSAVRRFRLGTRAADPAVRASARAGLAQAEQ